MPLIPLVAIVALGGAAAGWHSGRPGQPALAMVALPWLVLPPVILIAVSQIHPAYVERYVIFCIPALALLSAAGLTGLARLVATVPVARSRPVLGWAPTAVILVVLAVLLASRQHLTGPAAGRTTCARPPPSSRRMNAPVTRSSTFRREHGP